VQSPLRSDCALERVTCLSFLPLLNLERLISLFAVDAPGTRSKSLSAIQKTNAKVTNDKAWADYDYDKKHRNE
jgi:hypothetical protein